MDRVREGWERFAQADWAGARDAFSAALAEEGGDAGALDGLGQALWWLGRRDEAIELRREAYARHRQRGDVRSAGRLATYLSAEHRIDGRDAAAAGWLARARRLLDGLDAGPEHGWLAIEEAKRASDPADAERHARAALEVAHALGDPDVECMALAQLGRAVVRGGRVDEGVALLDEAMTVALGGESTDPLACGDACCTTLVVCDRLADIERAAQWCEAVVEFTERRRFLPMQGWCRGIYGAVLVRAGEWERAEAVLAEALRGVGDRRRGGGHRLALAVLADLRLRQGRTDEADALLTGLADDPVAVAPLVQLYLARGEPATGEALLDRHAASGAEDGDVLALRGAVALARRDAGAAGSIAARLEETAAAVDREDLRAGAALLAGRAAALRGDAEVARRRLHDAAARFAALQLPLEEGRAHLALATVEAEAGSPLALATARAARDVFERLGARRDADEAAALLRRLGVSGRTATRGERDELTAREREVLRLLAGGLSNAEIADRLVIAPKTAEHHVGRVLAKLGVRSRAEAAAHAVRAGI